MYERRISYDPSLEELKVVEWLACCLKEVSARDVQIDRNLISFTGGVFRLVTGWNVLVPFGYGELEIDPNSHTVIYRLSNWQQVVSLSILAAFVIAYSIYASLPTLPPWIVLFWVFGFGLNWAIGVWRFRRFLQRSLRSTRAINN